MQDIILLELLRKYLEPESEAYEVAQYCINQIALVRTATAAHHNPKMTEMKVPPESILLTFDYQSAVVNNTFYHKYFAPISSMLTLEYFKAHSLSKHLMHVADKDDNESKGIVRELTASRFEILTMVVHWEKGFEKAKEFDFFLRKATALSDQERRYFKKHGVE